jgi:hypothetical protein
MDGYLDKNTSKYGLTLKQRGKWAYAIGMGDQTLLMSGLYKI